MEPTAAPERTVRVPAERLDRWIAGFAERHGEIHGSLDDPETLRLHAADGAQAIITVPFPPLPATGDPVTGIVAHVERERRLGALLVRKGGFATGIFVGRRLIDAKVGSTYVQGRTKAGGWSQQRFSRRRENQATQAYAKAADAAAAILLPAVDDLEALVLGGDRAGVHAVLGDRRLAPLGRLATERVLPVAEPRRAVLERFSDDFLAVSIRVLDPY